MTRDLFCKQTLQSFRSTPHAKIQNVDQLPHECFILIPPDLHAGLLDALTAHGLVELVHHPEGAGPEWGLAPSTANESQAIEDALLGNVPCPLLVVGL